MATLVSEDEEYISSFTLSPCSETLKLNGIELDNQRIQYFNWQIKHGKRSIKSSASLEEVKQDPRIDGYILFRSPVDEVKQLVESLSLLVDNRKDSVMFEPSEPSFDLTITRQDQYGLKVQIFIDEGNVESGISRWDALGIRFFTQEDKLALFINELKKDFNC